MKIYFSLKKLCKNKKQRSGFHNFLCAQSLYNYWIERDRLSLGESEILMEIVGFADTIVKFENEKSKFILFYDSSFIWNFLTSRLSGWIF
jgi:hypothetical protein